MSDITRQLIDSVKQAVDAAKPLRIIGGDTKSFYGRSPVGEPLSISAHRGIVDYQPTELVVTARGGTALTDIVSTLSERGQMLAFEPPFYGDGATLGGAVACGLSGPRRPYVGAVRDFVLGVRVVNGRGEDLTFGGQVMKNVAGYDVSRLMVGAMGTLGIILEVSLKVLPLPKSECTLVLEADTEEAARIQNALAQRASPLSATCHVAGRLYIRFSGTEKGVLSARKNTGGEEMPGAEGFWADIREHRHEFFGDEKPLWRISVPPAARPLDTAGDWMMEWNGGLRWLKSDAPGPTLRTIAQQAGGQATLFRGGDRDDAFHPMNQGLLALHRNIKTAFDPAGVFNPGRMYASL